MKKKIIISLTVGGAVSTFALYFAFRNIPFVDLIKYLATINYLWIIPAALIVIISFIIRTIRWQIILGSVMHIGFFKAFHPLMIGFMLNLILPGRVGEVARPAILRQKEGVPFATGLATVAIERLFDLILLVILLSIVLATVQIDPNFNMQFKNLHISKNTIEMIGRGMLELCLVLIAGILILCFQKTRSLVIKIIMGLPSLLFFMGQPFKQKMQDGFCSFLVSIVEKIASGVEFIKNPWKLFICLVLSFLIWFLAALSFFVVAKGCPGINLTFSQHFAGMIIVCIFIALPSVPGFWGLWETGGIFALSLFGVLASDAAGYTLVNHAIQLFPILIIGIICAILTSVNILAVSYDKGGGK